jgi:hypothetical protein
MKYEIVREEASIEALDKQIKNRYKNCSKLNQKYWIDIKNIPDLFELPKKQKQEKKGNKNATVYTYKNQKKQLLVMYRKSPFYWEAVKLISKLNNMNDNLTVWFLQKYLYQICRNKTKEDTKFWENWNNYKAELEEIRKTKVIKINLFSTF